MKELLKHLEEMIEDSIVTIKILTPSDCYYNPGSHYEDTIRVIDPDRLVYLIGHLAQTLEKNDEPD
jgi:hypothetical protein